MRWDAGMSDVVLVHGSTQSAAGFRRLADALERRGHRVHAIDVPSGPRDARAAAERIAAQLPDDLDRPVVAAHSASGLLLPALAERLDARHQVWIAAAVPDHAGGRSFLDEVSADPAALMHDEWLGVDPTTDPVLATYFLFHDCDLATLRGALPTLARCDLADLYREVPPLDPAARPSTYLLPVGDRCLTVDGMRRMARERLGVEPVEVPGGHNAYVAHPEEIADLLTSP
jgi:pimeloyl-ACP methyl ester carboxylesterase